MSLAPPADDDLGLDLGLDLETLSAEFERFDALDIIAYAVDMLGDDVAVTSSVGADGAGMVHLSVGVKPYITVITIDTGFLCPGTIACRNELAGRLNLNLHVYRPKMKPAEFVQINGKMWRWESGANACCAFNKQEPMERAKKELGIRGWMAGIRREQSHTRRNAPIVQHDVDRLIKFSPIANWTSRDVHYYLQENDLPYHPLREQGYLSIGCSPEPGYCTRKVEPGQDPRAGRWAGFDKTECGLNTLHEGAGI